MKFNKLTSFTSLFILPLLISMQVITSHKVKEESEFNYIKGSEKGPEHWGQLREEWDTCSNGHMQSPINLSDDKVKVMHHTEKLKGRYKPSNATLVNRGHDIMLKWVNEAGSIYVDGIEYFLIQCHWHSPSEHTINGRRYSLELHMVHENLEKKRAVVAILYKIGRPDKFLSKLMGQISAINDSKDGEIGVGLVDPKQIKVQPRKYYRYKGSLTTPPCTEGVTWNILKKVRSVSREQVQLLREAVHGEFKRNARPTQATKHRAVHFYIPGRILPS
ncbi:alpha carbonic anhydrase 7-like [Magnolia sinica]|uniref:alpha carbonic anhydrase 7-like n=1 Tax=Magnolia sinica TaxID=86752 RepID=UPI00265A48E6|nr:alpha carbonic anhydrase 7-like [Magnolia sinica]